MTSTFSISVVIPTYLRRASVRRALEALSRQTLSPDEYEVIVAIDGSRDGTQEMVSQFPAAYKLRSIWQLADLRWKRYKRCRPVLEQWTANDKR